MLSYGGKKKRRLKGRAPSVRSRKKSIDTSAHHRRSKRRREKEKWQTQIEREGTPGRELGVYGYPGWYALITSPDALRKPDVINRGKEDSPSVSKDVALVGQQTPPSTWTGRQTGVQENKARPNSMHKTRSRPTRARARLQVYVHERPIIAQARHGVTVGLLVGP